MTILQAILLGALQGVTEFLPVSSSGHLALARTFMELQDVPVLFDILLHVATLVVVIWFFRKIILNILYSIYLFLFRKEINEEQRSYLRLTVAALIATLLTAGIGLFISDLQVEQFPKIVSLLFGFTAIILIITNWLNPKDDYSTIGLKAGIITGIAQGLGVLPGISRSGITITAALSSGLKRSIAGEFSFLISVPAILGALLLDLKDATTLGATVPVFSLIAGIISAMVVGWFSLVFLMKLVQKGKLFYFSIYLIPLSIIGMIFF